MRRWFGIRHARWFMCLVQVFVIEMWCWWRFGDWCRLKWMVWDYLDDVWAGRD